MYSISQHTTQDNNNKYTNLLWLFRLRHEVPDWGAIFYLLGTVHVRWKLNREFHSVYNNQCVLVKSVLSEWVQLANLLQ